MTASINMYINPQNFIHPYLLRIHKKSTSDLLQAGSTLLKIRSIFYRTIVCAWREVPSRRVASTIHTPVGADKVVVC